MNLLMVKRNLSLHIWQKSVVKNNIKFFWKTVIFVGVTKIGGSFGKFIV
jgi:hypothetical protein